MRLKVATELEPGDVLALPFAKQGTITQVKVGRQFVHFTTAEFGKSRVECHTEVMLEDTAEGDE